MRRPVFCSNNIIHNEEGSALIVALVILIVLTFVGQIATRTSNMEMRIATNDKQHKMTFYEADGSTELATELLEQNIEELGFDQSTMGTGGLIEIDTPDFYLNEADLATTPSDANRDFVLPAGASANVPHTNFVVGGRAAFNEGGAIEMAAAYEGRGKSAGQGGTKVIYDVVTQRDGLKNSESIVRIQWRHVN